MSGKSQRTIGAMNREECWEDFVSPDAEKITTIQMMTGSQYLMNERNFDTAHTKADSTAARQTLILKAAIALNPSSAIASHKKAPRATKTVGKQKHFNARFRSPDRRAI